MQPAKIPSLLIEISAGRWVDLEACWAVAHGKQPGVSCKRSWESMGGTRRDIIVARPFAAAAAVIGCHVDEQRCVQPHLSVRDSFQLERWVMNVSQLSQ